MAIQIGKLQVDYQDVPEGIVAEFVDYLASNANQIGRDSSLGFYVNEEIQASFTIPLAGEGMIGQLSAKPQAGQEHLDCRAKEMSPSYSSV